MRWLEPLKMTSDPERECMSLNSSWEISHYILQLHNLALNDFTFYKFLKLIYLFVLYFWLHWLFVAARGLSLVAASGGYSSLQCAGLSLRWLLLLLSMGSRHAGFSSCGTQAQ